MNRSKNIHGKTIIGRQTEIEIASETNLKVPAKIDTGAERSAIWASKIYVDKKDRLHFTLFDKKSEFYSGKKHITENYNIRLVKNSSGQSEMRFRIVLLVKIAGRKIRGTFTLADRSKNQFPILLGTKILQHKFLVDPAKDPIKLRVMDPENLEIVREFHHNRKGFFEKYYASSSVDKKFNNQGKSVRNLLKKLFKKREIR